MTWYSYHNYGSALQAYALQSVIKSLGYETYIVRYDPEPARAVKLSARRSLADRAVGRFRRNALGYVPYTEGRRERLFDDFVNDYISLTPRVSSNDDFANLVREYDAFVCGSDQIWSPRCFDARYYLDFVSDGLKKIAYAPSFGCYDIDDPALSVCIGELLNSFFALSAREDSGAEIIRKLSGRDVLVALDPTMLLDAREWGKVAAYDAVPEGPYCLCYFLGSDVTNWRAAYALARSHSLPVLVIPVFDRDMRRKGVSRAPIGPKEFIGLVEGASCVCTDSFHGMVFSSLFKRPLYGFERFAPDDPDSQNARVYSYISMMGLGERFVSRAKVASKTPLPPEKFDYSHTGFLVGCHRDESLKYLRDALCIAVDSVPDGGVR